MELRFVPAAAGAPKLAYEEETGPAGRFPVVFLHGIGGNRRNWRGQLEALRGRAHALAWDARGYGDSDDYEGVLTFPHFSADLLRLLDHLDAPRAHLVGLSMGGRIALDMVERDAARVASLVLCDTFPGFDASFTEEAREEFIRSRRDPLLRGVALRDMAPAVAKGLVSPTASDAVVEQLIESMAALHVESYIKAIEATTRYERVADLAAIEVPTQIIVGEDDHLTPPEISERMAKDIRGARLARIEDAGHLSNLERPERFNAVLLEFLAEVGALD